MGKVEDILSYIRSSQTKEILEVLNTSEKFNTEESKEIFLFLYDYTNSFKNANTTPEILILAGKMLESGIEHDQLIVEKTKKTFAQMKLDGDIIETIQLYKDDTIAGAFVSKDMLMRNKVDHYIGNSFMSNVLITISGCNFGFMLIEDAPDTYRALFGSKSDKNELDEIKQRLGIDRSNNIISGKTKEEIIGIITQ